MTAKELFEILGFKYEKIDNSNNNCEDIIIYTHTISDLTIQFNLMSKNVVINAKNYLKDKERLVIIMTKEATKAIYMQTNELGWNND